MRNAVNVFALVAGLVGLFLCGCGNPVGTQRGSLGGFLGKPNRVNSPSTDGAFSPVLMPSGPRNAVLSVAAKKQLQQYKDEVPTHLCIQYPGSLWFGAKLQVYAKECGKISADKAGLTLEVTDSHELASTARRPNIHNPTVKEYRLSYAGEEKIPTMILREKTVVSSRRATADHFGRGGTKTLQPTVELEILDFCSGKVSCELEFDKSGDLVKINQAR